MDRKGRNIDLAQCLVQANSVLLLVSPSRRQTLLTRLDQYIFFGDKVTPSHTLLQYWKYVQQAFLRHTFLDTKTHTAHRAQNLW